MPTKKKETPISVVNPFSEKFLEKWELWKGYKWEAHKFKYKGVMSEQTALGNLVTLSGGDESIAEQIILQSIGNQWQGLYPIKNNFNGTKTTSPRGGQQPVSRDQVQTELNRRYGGGEQNGSSKGATGV